MTSSMKLLSKMTPAMGDFADQQEKIVKIARHLGQGDILRSHLQPRDFEHAFRQDGGLYAPRNFQFVADGQKRFFGVQAASRDPVSQRA